MTLENDVAQVLNRHSRENASNTPDYVLANFLLACLLAYEQAVNERQRWHGGRSTNPATFPPPKADTDFQDVSRAPPAPTSAPGDLYVAGGHAYEVDGVYLGAVGQVSLIGLVAVREAAGWADGKQHATMFVPEPLLRSATLYKRADRS